MRRKYSESRAHCQKNRQKSHVRVCDHAKKAEMEVLEVLAFRLPKAIHKVMDTSAIKLACVRSIHHLVPPTEVTKG